MPQVCSRFARSLARVIAAQLHPDKRPLARVPRQPDTGHPRTPTVDKKRYIKILLGRLLAPSYIGTVVWVLTDTIEYFIGGMVLSVGLAVARPFVETLAEGVQELRAELEAKRKRQLVKAFVRFGNAYKGVLTKYPPALLPGPFSRSVAEQLELFARCFRTLKGLRTRQYATSFELVRAMSVAPGDFEWWDLDACMAFVNRLIERLSALSTGALRQAVKQFAPEQSSRHWSRHLEVAESDLDRAVSQTLSQQRIIQLALQNPDVCQRVIALLQLETIHRQMGLQQYLSAESLHCRPSEVRDMVTFLRYEPVVDKVLELIATEQGAGRL